ncbi:hypothetical protein GF377_11195 [candidate division GN15 bacterium]|nr:hypothetical protein [candidate division GN15 bacterium]
MSNEQKPRRISWETLSIVSGIVFSVLGIVWGIHSWYLGMEVEQKEAALQYWIEGVEQRPQAAVEEASRVAGALKEAQAFADSLEIILARYQEQETEFRAALASLPSQVRNEPQVRAYIEESQERTNKAVEQSRQLGAVKKLDPNRVDDLILRQQSIDLGSATKVRRD